jgi:hypothetical protein
MSQDRFNLSRRNLLAAAGTGITALVAPWIWVPKRAFAKTSAFGKAKHVLVLYAGGGMRGTAVFNAECAKEFNPYGYYPRSQTKTEWGVSRLFTDESMALPSFGDEALPSFLTVAQDIAVLPTVDHVPDYAGGGDGSHNSAPLRMATGYPDGLTSWLTLVGRHVLQKNSRAIPPFVVGDPARVFGLAAGEMAMYRPVMLGSENDFDRLSGSLSTEGGLGWAVRLEQALDDAVQTSRPYRGRRAVGAYMQSKEDANAFLETFLSPALQLDREPEATLGGLSNAQVLEALGDDHWGRRTALALRLLQIGSPAVVVGQSGYDNHSNEEPEMRPRIESLGRTLSALRFLLPRMPHPDGGTFWDHTVVSLCSEFGRDNTFADTGYNNGGGSDHHGSPAARFQTVPFMGGPVAARGAAIGPTAPETVQALGKVTHSQAVIATWLDLLGISWQGALDVGPVPELFA